MKHTRVVSTKCTPGFACRAFSDTTLVCFIVNEHTTKCSHYIKWIEYILWGIPTIESTFDVANMVKTASVKDVPINNDALLNIQAC